MLVHHTAEVVHVRNVSLEEFAFIDQIRTHIIALSVASSVIARRVVVQAVMNARMVLFLIQCMVRRILRVIIVVYVRKFFRTAVYVIGHRRHVLSALMVTRLMPTGSAGSVGKFLLIVGNAIPDRANA